MLPASTETAAVRCAVYTRKSTEEGLQEAFNSLEAQRDAAQAYVASQPGWILLPGVYDDGGFTGANMERPALARLLTDIEAGRIDCVVVYKVDRLSRSLLDFARIIGVFEKHAVSFVSVTQQFNTSAPIGRLTLHILLSFAQFEREMISERTRDHKAAARRKGKWTGGYVPLGYDLDRGGGRLIINDEEAARVRSLFELFLEKRSLSETLGEAARRGWTGKRWKTRAGKEHGGSPFTEHSLARLLADPLYPGWMRCEGKLYRGEHRAIVEERVWKRTHRILGSLPKAQPRERNRHGALLHGLLRCAGCGKAMAVTCTGKQKRRYRYYICRAREAMDRCTGRHLAADTIERAVVEQLSQVQSPLGRRVARAARKDADAGKPELLALLRSAVEAVVYNPATTEVTIRLRAAMPDEQQEIRCRLGAAPRQSPRKAPQCEENGCQTAAARQLPRITRLMALAIQLQDLVPAHADLTIGEVARLGHISAPRMTQILNLLHLAPDLQERLLWLEPVSNGRDRIHEHNLRHIAQLYDWREQRLAFETILAREGGPNGNHGNGAAHA